MSINLGSFQSFPIFICPVTLAPGTSTMIATALIYCLCIIPVPLSEGLTVFFSMQYSFFQTHNNYQKCLQHSHEDNSGPTGLAPKPFIMDFSISLCLQKSFSLIFIGSLAKQFMNYISHTTEKRKQFTLRNRGPEEGFEPSTS